MRKVTRVTKFGPDAPTTTEYDAVKMGPPGPRGLKGDKGDKGEDGGSGVSSVFGETGAVTAVDSIFVRCPDDGTIHEFGVVKVSGKYVWTRL